MSAKKVDRDSQPANEMDAALSGVNRSQDGANSPSNNMLTSGRNNQIDEPKFERQLTPGAADKSASSPSRGAFSKRRASDPAGITPSEILENLRGGHHHDQDLINDDLSPRPRSVEEKDCDKPRLNPEQALNLTDADVEDLRKLLVQNVSIVAWVRT